MLGKIYAVDFVEISLPINNKQLAYVNVPEPFRDSTAESEGPAVTLKATIGGKTWQWPGRIVRTEATIDTRSRQTYVIARVDDPYAQREPGQPPLKVGQFVEADIEGEYLGDAIVIPAAAVRAGSQVFVLDDEQRLQLRDVDILWSDDREAIITSGLINGEQLVLTPVNVSLIGSKAKIIGDKPSNDKPQAANAPQAKE